MEFFAESLHVREKDHSPGVAARDLPGEKKMMRSAAGAALLISCLINLAQIPVANGKAKKPFVIVSTYFRSGSSFIGDILQQSPRTFYYFEPLRFMTVDEKIAEQNKGKAFAVIEALARCNFTRLVHHLGWSDFRFVLRSKQFTANSWVRNASLVLTPEEGDKQCRAASGYVMKLTRVPMKYMAELLDRLTGLGAKVIYSVRDPRGIYNSRKKEKWCRENCKNLTKLCAEMTEDLHAFWRLRDKLPDRVTSLRLEDIAVEPQRETRKLFKKLNLSYTRDVNEFLQNHTQVNAENSKLANSTLSTVKNSRQVVLKWMNELTLDEISEAQQRCGRVFKELNYLRFGSEI